jgi:hypothetical protein
MPHIFGLMALSRGATDKSVAPAQLIFSAELRHYHYMTFLSVSNYARGDDADI